MRPSIPGPLAVLTIAAGLFAMASMTYVLATKPTNCAAKAQSAAISQRAAQICSTELVGCSLTFADIKAVVAEQEAAKACK